MPDRGHQTTPPGREMLHAVYHVVLFSEPEGHTTWAVREEIYGPNLYYRRQLVSFHPTKQEAETACEAYRTLDE